MDFLIGIIQTVSLFLGASGIKRNILDACILRSAFTIFHAITHTDRLMCTVHTVFLFLIELFQCDISKIQILSCRQQLRTRWWKLVSALFRMIKNNPFYINNWMDMTGSVRIEYSPYGRIVLFSGSPGPLALSSQIIVSTSFPLFLSALISRQYSRLDIQDDANWCDTSPVWNRIYYNNSLLSKYWN